jgi:hypothetical protein
LADEAFNGVDVGASTTHPEGIMSATILHSSSTDRRRAAIACGSAFAVLAMAGCGGGPAPASTTGSSAAAETTGTPSPTTAATSPASAPTAPVVAGGAFDYCTLITAAEARGAVGKPVGVGLTGPAQQTPVGPAGGCRYLATGTSVDSKTIVSVVVLGNKVTRAEYNQELLAKMNGSTPVAGLGETAVYIPGLVAVFDHGLAVTVQVVTKNVPSTDVALLSGLARHVLDRADGLR